MVNHGREINDRNRNKTRVNIVVHHWTQLWAIKALTR
jgi:hypothetical protein